MKYCEKYAALLDLFVDGELPPEEMDRVRAHLADCPGCRAYVDDALAIRAGFPDAEDTVVPDGFAEGVMKRVREASAKEEQTVERKRRSLRRWMGTAALAACCALVIFLRAGNDNTKGITAVTAGGADAPADCAAVEGDEAMAAPQMEMGEARIAPESEETAPEEAEVQATAKRAMEESRSAAMDDAAYPYEDSGLMAAAAAPTAPEAAMEEGASGSAAALRLTAEEVGTLLDEYAPVWESEKERGYELTAGAYQTLLEALGRKEEPPETEGTFLVVVTGSLE